MHHFINKFEDLIRKKLCKERDGHALRNMKIPLLGNTFLVKINDHIVLSKSAQKEKNQSFKMSLFREKKTESKWFTLVGFSEYNRRMASCH